ncbi:hypothetical protein ACP4OV_020294 [Aristida adscensionis]
MVVGVVGSSKGTQKSRAAAPKKGASARGRATSKKAELSGLKLTPSAALVAELEKQNHCAARPTEREVEIDVFDLEKGTTEVEQGGLFDLYRH